MDEENFTGFTINKEYAAKYNAFREKEELHKLKARYGDEYASDESTSDTEDEDAEGLTPNVEKAWLKTLAAIKSKNPKIYDKTEHFFDSDSSSDSDVSDDDEPKKKDSKPMYIKDYERKVILEKGGVLSDEDADDSEGEGKTTKEFEQKPGYYEEQKQILDSFKEAMMSDSEQESDGEQLLTKRTKSDKELEKEEEDYIEWLKGQKEDFDEETGKELNPLKEYWNDPKLSEGEQFLRDYLLNKRYLEESEDRIPTYEEIVKEEDFSEEDEQIEKEELFEVKYNFRFEEPDKEFIKTPARVIEDSVRRKDTKRIDKRKAQKEKKKKEKEKVQEELKQLKNLKKKEIQRKLNKLKEVAGEENLGMGTNDIEGDFDPEAHDKLMKEVFNKQYYQQEEDDEKPTWSDDEELGLHEWDEYNPPAKKSGAAVAMASSQHQDDGSNDENEDDESDADNKSEKKNSNTSQEMEQDSDRDIDPTKKTKKKSLFQKAVEKKKPVFDPTEKSFAKYLEEFYKLDYEDIVAGQPCRFKYRNVAANDFGLSTDEVLKAKEKDLNRWVSIKKMSQYRTVEEEMYDQRLFNKRGKNEKHKRHVLTSLHEEDEDLKEENSDKKKRKRKKKNNSTRQEQEVTKIPPTKKIKLFNEDEKGSDAEAEEEDQDGGEHSALQLSTLTKKNEKKRKKTKKKRKGESLEEQNEGTNENASQRNQETVTPERKSQETETPQRIKKKKNKTNADNEISGNVKNQSFDSKVEDDCNSDSRTANKNSDSVTPSSKKKKKNKGICNKDESDKTLEHKKETVVDTKAQGTSKLTCKKNKKGKSKPSSVLQDERFQAYGINPKKFKYAQKAKMKKKLKS